MSLFCMTLAKKIKGLSMAGVSVIGGVTHNIGAVNDSCTGSRKWKCLFLFSDITLRRDNNRTFNRNCIFRNL